MKYFNNTLNSSLSKMHFLVIVFVIGLNSVTANARFKAEMIFEDDTAKPDVLEQRGRYHYPSMIQTRDGLLHLTYTYNTCETPYADGENNAIKHVVIDPADL